MERAQEKGINEGQFDNSEITWLELNRRIEFYQQFESKPQAMADFTIPQESILALKENETRLLVEEDSFS